jgi:sec-independent protein translocase protein TatA
MNTIVAGMLGGWEIVLILAVVLILFGAKKLPELAKGLGSGIKEFKKATREVTEELQSAVEDDYTPPPPQQTRKLSPSESKPAETVAQSPAPASEEVRKD